MVSKGDKTFNSNATITPITQAFYERKANYFVIPSIGYSVCMAAFATCLVHCSISLTAIIGIEVIGLKITTSFLVYLGLIFIPLQGAVFMTVILHWTSSCG
jgi:hypothetical protein